MRKRKNPVTYSVNHRQNIRLLMETTESKQDRHFTKHEMNEGKKIDIHNPLNAYTVLLVVA